MTGTYPVLLALGLFAAASPERDRPKLKVPDAAALAPIRIPSVTPKQSAFAQDLGSVCKALTRKPAPDQERAKSAREVDRKFTRTCDRLSSGERLDADDREALKAFRENPSRIRDGVEAALKEPVGMPQGPGVTPSSSSGSFEAALINGLAKFIYDRAKEEAEAYVTRQLSTLLCADEVRPFFTSLCVVFGNPDPKLSLSAMGSYLGAAARSDAERLPDVALVYGSVQLNDTNDPKGEGRELLFGTRLGLAYYLAVSSGRTPLDVARSLHALETQTRDEPSGRVLAAVGSPSALVDAVTQQKGWQALTDGAPNTLTAASYALGVLFSLDEIDSRRPFSTADMQIVSANVPVIAQFVVDLAALNARIEQVIIDISSPRDDSGGGFSGGTTPARHLSMKDYVLLTTQLLDRTLRDGLVLAQAFNLVDRQSAALVGHVRTVLQLGERVVAGDLAGVVLAAALKMQEIDVAMRAADVAVFSPVLEKVRNLTPLVAEMAQARSAEQVTAVLQAAAAPANAYENKYKGGTVALNAAVGVALGTEGVENKGLQWGGFAGAFAPVGLHATLPLGSKFHLGGFVSVINLGALVSARFKADTSTGPSKVQSDPNVSFANVLSPGAFLTLGLFGSPFMLGGGVQAVPASRSIQTTNADGTRTSSAAGMQILGFLGVDVPLFTF